MHAYTDALESGQKYVEITKTQYNQFNKEFLTKKIPSYYIYTY